MMKGKQKSMDDKCIQDKCESIAIIEYWDKSSGMFFQGTEKEFEIFKKYHGIYPYKKLIKENK